MKLRTTILAALLFAIPTFAQLVKPNAQGVTMGHIHLHVKDVAAHTHFWVDIMGGKPVHNEKLAMIEFPGVYLILTQDDPTGPPDGSIVDHFGFVVRDMPKEIAKWEANHLKVEQTGNNPNQRYVWAPDEIRLEVFGDPTLAHPVEMNHIHFSTHPRTTSAPCRSGTQKFLEPPSASATASRVPAIASRPTTCRA